MKKLDDSYMPVTLTYAEDNPNPVISISNVSLYAVGSEIPVIQNTGVLHLVSVDPDGRRVYTSSGFIEPTGYRFDQNLPGELSVITNLTSGTSADFNSFDDLESWIWPVGVTATVNEVPEASTIGQFAIFNGTDLFVATSLNPTTWEPVRPDHESLRLAHSYGSDQIVAPYSPTLTPHTYSLPGRTGTLALNDGVGFGRSGTNLILGKITGITGSSNTGVGYNALSSITSGSYNTAVGSQALGNCLSGMSNVAFGIEALQNLISVGQNSAFGNSALRYVTVGVGNTGIGFRAGYSNVVGQANLTQGKNNTLLGNSAGVDVNSRSQSIALGYRATTQADGELAIGAASAAIKGGTTGVTYNATDHGINYTVTPPANPNTPVGWLDARINGILFKTPLYQ